MKWPARVACVRSTPAIGDWRFRPSKVRRAQEGSNGVCHKKLLREGVDNLGVSADPSFSCRELVEKSQSFHTDFPREPRADPRNSHSSLPDCLLLQNYARTPGTYFVIIDLGGGRRKPDACLEHPNLSDMLCQKTPPDGVWFAQVRFHTTIDTEIKAKRNNMISELITFRITKAKEKVNFGVKYLYGHQFERSSVQLISIRRRK